MSSHNHTEAETGALVLSVSNPGIGSQRLEDDCKFKARLVYRISSRPARATDLQYINYQVLSRP